MVIRMQFIPGTRASNDAQSRLIDSALRGCIKRTIDRWCPETAPPPRDDGWRHLLTIEPAPKLPKRNRALHLNVDATALDRSSLVKMDRGSSWLSAYAVLRAWWPFAMLRRRALMVPKGSGGVVHSNDGQKVAGRVRVKETTE